MEKEEKVMVLGRRIGRITKEQLCRKMKIRKKNKQQARTNNALTLKQKKCYHRPFDDSTYLYQKNPEEKKNPVLGSK